MRHGRCDTLIENRKNTDDVQAEAAAYPANPFNITYYCKSNTAMYKKGSLYIKETVHMFGT